MVIVSVGPVSKRAMFTVTGEQASAATASAANAIKILRFIFVTPH
jgi:hypothetical protein